MRIKIISAITALCMSATVIGVALTANGKGNGVTPSQSQTTVTGSASSSTALNVIKYGDKLTQDQVMSQIKAQYLIENGGYKDTDEVVVMVAVDGESLIETFNGRKNRNEIGFGIRRVVRRRSSGSRHRQKTERGYFRSSGKRIDNGRGV